MKNYKLKINDNLIISIGYPRDEGGLTTYTTNIKYKDSYIDYDRYGSTIDEYDMSEYLDILESSLFDEEYFDEEMDEEYLNFYIFGIKITPFKDTFAVLNLCLENGIDYIDVILEKDDLEEFYYYLLLVYNNDLNNANIAKLIDDKKIIDNNLYFIVTVTFYDRGKEYQYLCSDESVEEDEYVLVPVGDNNELKRAKVIKADYYAIEDIKYDVKKMKLVERRVDE